MLHRPRQGQGWSSWRRKTLDCQESQDYPSFVRKAGREKSKKQPGAEFRVGLLSFFTFPIHVNPAGTWNLLGICHLFYDLGKLLGSPVLLARSFTRKPRQATIHWPNTAQNHNQPQKSAKGALSFPRCWQGWRKRYRQERPERTKWWTSGERRREDRGRSRRWANTSHEIYGRIGSACLRDDRNLDGQKMSWHRGAFYSSCRPLSNRNLQRDRSKATTNLTWAACCGFRCC